MLQPHWASFRTLNVPRASVLALLSSWDILPPKIHMAGFISSHHGCAKSSVCFSKRPLFPFSESTSITVLSYQPVCFLYDTIQKLLSEIFLSVCSWTQPVSYHRMSATPKQRLRLVLCPVGLVHHKISTIFFFLSKRALRIPSFIEQNLGKSALIFLMVYLQLCLVICCNWVEERAYSQTLGYLCNYLIEYMKDL